MLFITIIFDRGKEIMKICSGNEALEYICARSLKNRIEMHDRLMSLDSTDMHLLSCDSDLEAQAYHQYLPTLYNKFGPITK